MKKFITSALFLFLFGSLWAQTNGDEKQIVIALSDPSKPGKLRISAISGSITVKGYNGKEVIVRALPKTEKSEEVKANKDGLKRIPNDSFRLQASEENNQVNVSSNANGNSVDFEVMVPQKFSLSVKTVNDGDVIVENVDGEIEATNVNGPITLRNVGGTVVANTINGDLLVTMNRVDANVPMAFSNLNGDIDITFPANIKATAKIRSDRGEIYSDFDMNVLPNKAEVKKESGGKYTSYSIEKGVVVEINGGGPEFLFKNMNGDVIIRKK
jgi:Putative adhesin